jgi:hypothetical protein
MAARLRGLDAGVDAVEASYLYLLLLHKDSERGIDHQRLAELLGWRGERGGPVRVDRAARGDAVAVVEQGHRHPAQYGLWGD